MTTPRAIPLLITLVLASGAQAEGPTMRLQELLNDHWEWQMQTSPIWATSLGDHRFDHLWSDDSLDAKTREGVKLGELRERAEAQLGLRFDVRAFHDLVLGSGAVPLDVLEANVTAWLAARAQAPSP